MNAYRRIASLIFIASVGLAAFGDWNTATWGVLVAIYMELKGQGGA